MEHFHCSILQIIAMLSELHGGCCNVTLTDSCREKKQEKCTVKSNTIFTNNHLFLFFIAEDPVCMKVDECARPVPQGVLHPRYLDYYFLFNRSDRNYLKKESLMESLVIMRNMSKRSPLLPHHIKSLRKRRGNQDW